MIKYFLLVLVSSSSFAINTDPEGYRYVQYDYQHHDLFSNCKFVHNASSTSNVFVTTKTTAEWSAFFTNPPTGMAATPCYENIYTGNYTHNSQKFYMAKYHETCDEKCSTLGGCVSSGFAAIADVTECQTVVEAIVGSTPAYTDSSNPAIWMDSNPDPDTNPNTPSTTLGCTFYESTDVKIGAVQVRYFRTTTPTCDAMTTTTGYMRVCPCAN